MQTIVLSAVPGSAPLFGRDAIGLGVVFVVALAIIVFDARAKREEERADDDSSGEDE